MPLQGLYVEHLKTNFFEELGLQSLQHRRWYRKQCCFYKILKDQSPRYLFIIIPKLTRPYLQGTQIIFLILKLNSFFKNSVFSIIIEWNKMDPEIQNAPSLNIFKKNILTFRRPTANNIFSCQNLKGIQYL